MSSKSKQSMRRRPKIAGPATRKTPVDIEQVAKLDFAAIPGAASVAIGPLENPHAVNLRVAMRCLDMSKGELVDFTKRLDFDALKELEAALRCSKEFFQEAAKVISIFHARLIVACAAATSPPPAALAGAEAEKKHDPIIP